MTGHDLVRCDTATAAAGVAAQLVADALAARLGVAPTASLAVSGGSSPAQMFAALAESGLEWARVDVFQVDERVAREGDAARNLTGLRAGLGGVLAPERLHPIPVELGAEPAAADYAGTLLDVLGPSPTLDVVHLGLGADGHTASLVPGDATMEVTDRDVAATAGYRGHRRVTLTFPALDRAELAVWLVTGADKAAPLRALLAGDTSIPAGRVRARRSVVVCDSTAAG